MGVYSWRFCNCRGRLIIGRSAYLLMPDGNHIYEYCYNGYGNFGPYDVYEVMAEQNRSYLKRCRKLERYVNPPGDSTRYASTEWYELAVKRFGFALQRMRDFASGKDEDYMCEHYGSDWLREIGIDLDFCPGKYKCRLPFRIKVASEPVDYNSVRPSSYDDRQGCY